MNDTAPKETPLPEPTQKLLYLLMQLAPYEGGLIRVAGGSNSGKSALIAQFIAKAQPLWAVVTISSGLPGRMLLLAIAEKYNLRVEEDDQIDEISRKLRDFFRLSQQNSQHSIIVMEDAEALSEEAATALAVLLEGATKGDFCIILVTDAPPVASAQIERLLPYVSRTLELADAIATPAFAQTLPFPWLKAIALLLMGTLALAAVMQVKKMEAKRAEQVASKEAVVEPLPLTRAAEEALPPPEVLLTPDPQPVVVPESPEPMPEPPKLEVLPTVKTPPVETNQESVDIAPLHDENWLLAQPPLSYTVQIIALKNSLKIKRISESLEAKGQTLAHYPMLRKSGVLDALVYGIFTTQAEAQRIAEDPSLSVEGIKPWVRRLDEVHADIEKAKAATIEPSILEGEAR